MGREASSDRSFLSFSSKFLGGAYLLAEQSYAKERKSITFIGHCERMQGLCQMVIYLAIFYEPEALFPPDKTGKEMYSLISQGHPYKSKSS